LLEVDLHLEVTKKVIAERGYFCGALQMLYRCFTDTAKLVDDFRK
jgi:hypothetical protein|tara:strand:- start:19561 stop:19695 length:135 start_codon:yes stop_codon:yes gene_type:complete